MTKSLVLFSQLGDFETISNLYTSGCKRPMIAVARVICLETYNSLMTLELVFLYIFFISISFTGLLSCPAVTHESFISGSGFSLK